jgi:hypothetical protein
MRKPEVLQPVLDYLVEHPDELVRIAKKAVALEFGVPLSALRWAVSKAAGDKAPADLTLEAVPPGVRIGATVALMGARLRASALVNIETIRIDRDELRLEVRVSEVSLTLLNSSSSPLAALIQSGALDLTKIGNLVAVMPRRPAFLVEAKDDRIVLDLKRHPAFSGQRVERILGLVTPLVTVTGVATDLEHLDVKFGVLNQGLGVAVSAWRGLVESLVFARGGPRRGGGGDNDVG